MPESRPLLEVRNLTLAFRTARGRLLAVDRVSFDLRRNESLVVIGESGCGKSSLMRGILRLLPRNVHTYTGEVFLNGENIMALPEERFRREVRWTKISFVPQAALNALNPVLKVGDQVAEPLLVHKLAATRADALERARRAFRLVGVPEDFLHRYPFELSGGMRQRVSTATALVTNPQLVVMDEPTSALDVLTQANMMNLLKEIKREVGASFILVTHDIATSSEIADQVAVMYAGQIIERAAARHFFAEPLHPYSRKLLASVPTLKEKKQLEFIPGQPPSLFDLPQGCRFAPRCPARFERCSADPPLVDLGEGRQVRCWLYEKGGELHGAQDGARRSA